MARSKKEIELAREHLEGDLAPLGNARVYLRLVADRVRYAAVTHPDVLLPALQDIGRADALIMRVQQSRKDGFGHE